MLFVSRDEVYDGFPWLRTVRRSDLLTAFVFRFNSHRVVMDSNHTYHLESHRSFDHVGSDYNPLEGVLLDSVVDPAVITFAAAQTTTTTTTMPPKALDSPLLPLDLNMQLPSSSNHQERSMIDDLAITIAHDKSFFGTEADTARIRTLDGNTSDGTFTKCGNPGPTSRDDNWKS